MGCTYDIPCLALGVGSNLFPDCIGIRCELGQVLSVHHTIAWIVREGVRDMGRVKREEEGAGSQHQY